MGTSVCLRCRQEARQAARARQQSLLAKLGLGAAVVVGVYFVGASSINGWRAASRVSRVREAAPLSSAAIVTPQGEPTPNAVVVATPAALTAPAARAEIALVAAPLGIVVPEGRTELKDSVVAERTGNDVVVSFDLMMTRTRRRDKFERVVRETLPAVYGARVDSVLAAIPDGSLVTGGDLLTELPARGIHLPLGDGYHLGVWPETRPGRDGLLVVRYRTRVERQ